jgi:hypothetical protein
MCRPIRRSPPNHPSDAEKVGAKLSFFVQDALKHHENDRIVFTFAAKVFARFLKITHPRGTDQIKYLLFLGGKS